MDSSHVLYTLHDVNRPIEYYLQQYPCFQAFPCTVHFLIAYGLLCFCITVKPRWWEGLGMRLLQQQPLDTDWLEGS